MRMKTLAHGANIRSIREGLVRSALVVCLAAALSGWAHPPRSGAESAGGVPVRFAYEDARAQEVSVVGDFARWKPLPMKRRAKTWILEITLPPGRYLYAFLVDKSTWQPDPWATSFDESSLGKVNSVLIVE